MKKIVISIVTLCLLLHSNFVIAQNSKISFSEVAVAVKSTILKGDGVSVSLKDEKTSEKLVLYKSDTLLISAAYRLKSTGKKQSEIKDPSFGLEIQYTCVYKGREKEVKVERLYFLNDKFQFDEKETFNIPESKNVNTQVKISYKGTINQ